MDYAHTCSGQQGCQYSDIYIYYIIFVSYVISYILYLYSYNIYYIYIILQTVVIKGRKGHQFERG